MRVEIAPSLLSADFSKLGAQVEEAASSGADCLHFDIMDGHFVPNITFGPMVVRAVRGLTDTPFRVHLMITNPDDFIDDFAAAGANSISVHVETCPHLHRTVQHIKSRGVKAAVAINPATSVTTLEEIAGDLDAVLVMTVNPGFGAQEFIEESVDKIARTRLLLNSTGREIDLEVDGGINENTIERVVAAGANILIAGNSVFANHAGVSASIAELRRKAETAAKTWNWSCTSSA